MIHGSSARVRVLGEALVDLVAATGAHTYTAHPGGSPANVAVDLARLGVPVTFHGRIGRDAFGHMLRDHLTDNDVDVAGVVTASEPTTIAVATVDEAGVAHFDFWTAGTANWQWRPGELPDRLPEDTVALHTGSLAAWLAPSSEHVAALLAREHARARATLSLDPNCRPDLMGNLEEALAWIEHLVGLVDVVKVSQDDLRWVLPGRSPEQAAERWLALGPALVVVTLGGDGAYGLTRSGASAAVSAMTVEVADTIGAGDAFTAGLLAGLYRANLLGPGTRAIGDLAPSALRELLANAAVVAALTCSRPGAEGPTAAEIRTRR